MKYHCLEDFSVRFAETDAAGVVHFSNFLRWAENAEGDFFRKNGLSIIEKKDAETHLGWPKVNVSTDFKAPARYADRIRVKIRPTSMPLEGARSLTWEFAIFRIEKNESETLLASGSWKSVFAKIEANGKIRTEDSLPASVHSALATLSN